MTRAVISAPDSLPTDDTGYGRPWLRLRALAITLMPNAAERSLAEFPTHAMPILRPKVEDPDVAARRFSRIVSFV